MNGRAPGKVMDGLFSAPPVQGVARRGRTNKAGQWCTTFRGEVLFCVSPSVLRSSPEFGTSPDGWVLGTSRQGKGSAGKPLFSHLGKGVAEFRRHRSASSRALTRHISAPVWVGCFRCGFVLRASGWLCVFGEATQCRARKGVPGSVISRESTFLSALV